MKNKSGILITICVAVLFGLAIGLFSVEYYHSDKWYEGTTINGIDCSLLSIAEAEEMLLTDYSLEIIGIDGNSVTLAGRDVNLERTIADSLNGLFSEQHSGSYLLNAIFSKTENDYSVTASVTFDEDMLSDFIESSALMIGDGTYVINEAEDAYIEWDGSVFAIVDDNVGNEIDLEKTCETVAEAIYGLFDTVTLTEECYVAADTISDDLTDICLEMNIYALHWLTWDMGDGVTEELTPETLSQWVSYDEEGVIFDEDALYSWMEELCLEYKTVGTSRTFTTHDGETITISGGDYGWQISYSTFCEDATEALDVVDEEAVKGYVSTFSEDAKAALSIELDVVWSSTGYQTDYISFNYDWDLDNYSEVDISAQMVYVYKDGELVFSCKCVTGLPDGDRDTSTGVWYIKDKKEDYTMTSTKYDYVTPTKYWIRITWTGIGYHYMNRSDWDSWSPSLYKTAGSHGCINLTLDDAATIYSLVSIGDAVFIHD